MLPMNLCWRLCAGFVVMKSAEHSKNSLCIVGLMGMNFTVIFFECLLACYPQYQIDNQSVKAS